MYALAERLYPICRSITGYGLRQTLEIMAGAVPLEIEGVASGTRVFDWQVPDEWRLDAAYIQTPDGERIADVDRHSLHLMSYSLPGRRTLTLPELLPHLYSLPQHPEWIPYRTSYYEPDWGFCLPHQRLCALVDGTYEAVIEGDLSPGELNYGELLIPGRSDREVLFFSHACHPSLANDNLAGLVTTCALAQRLLSMSTRRYSYRFVWAPGTIGSIVWLARNQARLREIKGGLVAVLLGDKGQLQYKPSRNGDSEIDAAAAYVCGRRGGRVREFEPYGYDERQFASPGIALPVGRLTRTPNGEYAEYHTSADDLSLILPEQLEASLDALSEFVDVLEHNRRYVNLQPYCEPQLGKRGLYRKGGGEALPDRNIAMLWALNQSDGKTPLLDIAERSQIPFSVLRDVAAELESSHLLEGRGDAEEGSDS
ncbi:MAG: DUF4910 domain-containing protein [Pseudomonadales bacterium]